MNFKNINNVRLSKGFGMVSNDVIRNPALSLREKSIYAYLCTYSNKTTNELHVGIKRMAAENGVTESTIKRILQSLIRKNVIFRTASKTPGGNSKTLILK